MWPCNKLPTHLGRTHPLPKDCCDRFNEQGGTENEGMNAWINEYMFCQSFGYKNSPEDEGWPAVLVCVEQHLWLWLVFLCFLITPSNFSFNFICKVQPLNCVALWITTAICARFMAIFNAACSQYRLTRISIDLCVLKLCRYFCLIIKLFETQLTVSASIFFC